MGRIAFFREIKRYSYSDFAESILRKAKSGACFLPDEEKICVEKIIRELKSHSFLKILKNPDSSVADYGGDDNNGEFNEEKESRDYSNLENRGYSFCCVGMIKCCGIIIIVYPKYIKDEKRSILIARFKIAFAALREYVKSKKNFSDRNEENESEIASARLSLELSILEDYNENGLYRRFASEMVVNGVGEIDWCRTIDEIQPFFKNGRPYYLDLLTNELTDDDSNYITRLHEVVISEISRDFASSGLSEIFDISGIELTPMTLGDFDSSNGYEYVKYRIECEQHEQYVTRMQRVLKYLHEYIDNADSKNDDSDRMEYYATNSFYAVWEKACQKVFRDCKDDKLIDIAERLEVPERDELGYKAKDAIDGEAKEISFYEMSAMELIDKPLWDFTPSDKRLASETLRPDVIVIEKNRDVRERGNLFAILDAKYYCYECKGNESIKFQPGIYSVVKQYAYIDAFEHDDSEFFEIFDVQKIANAFVFPMQDSQLYSKRNILQSKGFVRLDFLDRLHGFAKNNNDAECSSGSIQIIEVNPDYLFSKYLSGSSMLEELLTNAQGNGLKWRESGGANY